MQFTPEETEKLEAMFMFIIKRKHKSTAGHGGFNLKQLEHILEGMAAKGKILKRDTINSKQYFLTNK